MRGLVVTALLVVAGAGGAGAQTGGLPLPPGKQFAQNPNLPPGGEFVVLAGVPTAAGPYAFRVRFAPGLRVLPHSHPDDRLYQRHNDARWAPPAERVPYAAALREALGLPYDLSA